MPLIIDINTINKNLEPLGVVAKTHAGNDYVTDRGVSITIDRLKSENTEKASWYRDTVGSFYIDELSGCCGIVVIHHAAVVDRNVLLVSAAIDEFVKSNGSTLAYCSFRPTQDGGMHTLVGEPECGWEKHMDSVSTHYKGSNTPLVTYYKNYLTAAPNPLFTHIEKEAEAKPIKVKKAKVAIKPVAKAAKTIFQKQ